jgi:hypothetical protein
MWTVGKNMVQSKVVLTCRLRAQRRLDALKAFLKQLRCDPAAVRAEFEHPTILHPARLAAWPGKPPLDILHAALVVPSPLRIHRTCDMLLQWQPQAVEAPEHYMHEPEPLMVPMEHKLLGYQPQSLQDFVGYLPVLLDQPLASGAPEEGLCLPLLSLIEPEPQVSGPNQSSKGVKAPTMSASATPTPPADPTIGSFPPQVIAPPHTSALLGSRYAATNDAVAAKRLPVYGFDREYPLRPRPISLPSSAAQEALASNTIRVTHGLPMLAETWQRRRAGGCFCGDVFAGSIPDAMAGPAPEDLFTQTWVRPTC